MILLRRIASSPATPTSKPAISNPAPKAIEPAPVIPTEGKSDTAAIPPIGTP